MFKFFRKLFARRTATCPHCDKPYRANDELDRETHLHRWCVFFLIVALSAIGCIWQNEPNDVPTEPAVVDAHITAEVAPEPVPFAAECTVTGEASSGQVKVTVGYADCDDSGGGLRADDIAHLAEVFTDVWSDRGYPNPEKVREHLSRFHVLAVHTDDCSERSAELARLYKPDLEPAEALDKLGAVVAFCSPTRNKRYVDVPADANFFIAIESFILAESWSDIVAHEMAHGALQAAYGDADGTHLRGDIWYGNDGALLEEVFDRFTATKQ